MTREPGCFPDSSGQVLSDVSIQLNAAEKGSSPLQLAVEL